MEICGVGVWVFVGMGVGDAFTICSVCRNNTWAVSTMDLSVGLGVFATPDEGDWLEDLQDTSTKS